MAMSVENQRKRRCVRCEERGSATSYCFVCKVYLCVVCHRKHRCTTEKRARGNRLLHQPEMCKDWRHDRETVNLYCQRCHECICKMCRVEGHATHYVVDIYKVAQKRKNDLEEAIEQAERNIAVYEDEIEESTSLFESRKEEIRRARRNVTAIVKELTKSLKEHENAVLTELDGIDKQNENRHAIHHGKLKQLVARLKSPVERGESILRRNIDVEIVRVKQNFLDRLNLSETVAVFDLPFVNYVTDEKLCERVRLLNPGQLIVSDTDVLQSKARGEGLRKPVVGEETEILVRTNDSRGKQCYYEDDIVQVKIQSALEEELEKEFKNANDGQYKVTFTPKSVGQHEVMINVNGQPLTNSPWSIQVHPHQYVIRRIFGVEKYDDDDDVYYITRRRSKLYLPKDVAISQVTGNIAVLDVFGITLFEPNGRFVSEFGDHCTGKRLKAPQSVAVSCSGDIIVIDRQNITLCTERGEFVRYFRKHTKSASTVSVSRDGRVIVCEKDDALVKVLSPNGEQLLQTFGDPELHGIPSYAIHHKDKFFVSYQKEHCVMVFSNNGTFLYDIGAPEGNERKSLQDPLGLAVDKFNNLIVCDSEASRLQVFSLEGKYLSTISGFKSPKFVAVSEDGHLYVTDVGKECVYVLK